MPQVMTLEGHDMAMDDFGTMDDFGFISAETLRESLPSAVGGLASGTLYGAARKYAAVQPMLSRPMRMAAGTGLGILAGLFLWNRQRELASGIAGGMLSAVGTEVGELVVEKLGLAEGGGTDGFLSDAETDYEAEAALMAAPSFAQLPEEQELMALSDPAVEDEMPTGFADVHVEEEINPGVAAAISY